jgi:Flp pilus assembly protein TadD
VGLFRKKVYVRANALAIASKAAARGRRKKAIAAYREILEHEPDDAMVLSKLAELLARTKQLGEAREKFVRAAEGFERRGFDEKALATYANAAMYMPRDVEMIAFVAGMHLKRGHDAEAIHTFLIARKKLKRRSDRALAIRLLNCVVEIEPNHVEATLDLARLLAKQGKTDEARTLLEALLVLHRNRQLRRIRGALFRLSPSAGAAWRWLRAATRGT